MRILLSAIMQDCGKIKYCRLDQVETDNASVQASCSGKTATFTFASTVSNSLTIGVA